MAIGTPYNVGTASNKDSTTITLTTTASVPSGDSIILCIVCNASGVTNPSMVISDSAGNSYSYVTAPAEDTVKILIYWADKSVSLNSGSTITITYTGVVPTPLMAASATGVNGIDNKSVRTGSNATLGTGTSPSVSFTSIINGTNYLALSFLGTEGPTGDTFTQDTANGWDSPPTRVGTTGGAAVTNNTLAGGYKIANNVSSFDYAPTITSRNWVVVILVFQEAVPNTLYWVGGTSPIGWTQNAATNWALTSGGTGGAGVPTGETDVVINGASDSGTNFTINIQSDDQIKCKNFTITGLDVGVTLSQDTGFIQCFGNFSIPASNVSFAGLGNDLELILLGNGGTQTLDAGGGNYSIGVTIDGTSSVELQNNWVSDRIIDLNSGGFKTNNYNVTIFSLSANTSNTKTIDMGSSTWTITGNLACWNVTGTGTTLLKGTSTIIFTNTNASFSTSFFGGGLNYHNITIAGNTTTNTFQINDSNTFNTFTSTKTVAFTLKFQSGTTNTFNNFTVTGTSGNVVTLSSITAGTQATLRKYSPWLVGANSTNVSGNTGLTFSGGGGLDYLTIQDINGVELEPLTKSNMFFIF